MEAGPLNRPHRDEGDLPDTAFADDARALDDDLVRVDALMSPGRTGLAEDGVDGGPLSASDDPDDEHELRPQRRLRIWQTAPIVALGVLGSLMFAFPLAFGFGDQGPVVAMLGLLLSASSAGWGIMVARRVGYTWPGLPQHGSGGRPDWRIVVAYTLACLLVGALAVWRVARLQ